MRLGEIKTDIIENGLVFNMDPANRASTVPSMSTDKTFNTVDTSISGSFVNDTIYDSSTISPSYALDGTTDYIRVGNSSNNSTFAFEGSATFSIWIYPISNNCMFLTKRNTGIGWELGLDTGGYISWYLRSSGLVTYDTANGTTLTLNSWSNITIILDRNANLVSRYLNASLTGTNTSISGLTSLSDNTTDVCIGGRYARNDQFLNGNIGPIQIYNRALSSTEVLHNFNALRGRFEV